jgi:hypothetical protein
MRIQETLLGLERGIHMADMLGLNDADLNRLERDCCQWQQAAAIELCRRSGMRPDQKGLPLTMGAGKSFSGVRLTEGHGHD